MTGTNPSGLLDKLVGAAITVLVAALALNVAAKLIAAVWSILLACLVVAAVIGLAIALVRSRSTGGW